MLITCQVTFSSRRMFSSSSLVREPTKLATDRPRSRWSPKARRWYQRLLSGATYHQANRRILRVITLTTSPASRADRDLDLNDSFQVLRKRILRKWGSRFDYWKLRTSEGNGVLHIIYAGSYIPVTWLKQNWTEIHRSPIVFIQKLRGKRKRMINYLMGHYLPAHDHGGIYTRMSWSWGWVFRGFAGAWKWFWKRGPTMTDCLVEWNRLMRRGDPLTSYKRMRGLLWKQQKLKKDGTIVSMVSYPSVS